jgi:hypothetical protein
MFDLEGFIGKTGHSLSLFKTFAKFRLFRLVLRRITDNGLADVCFIGL